MNPLTYLPAKARAAYYAVVSVAGLALGGTSAFYAAVSEPQPRLLIGALGVYAYLGIATGITALSNVTRDVQPGPEPEPGSPADEPAIQD